MNAEISFWTKSSSVFFHNILLVHKSPRTTNGGIMVLLQKIFVTKICPWARFCHINETKNYFNAIHFFEKKNSERLNSFLHKQIYYIYRMNQQSTLFVILQSHLRLFVWSIILFILTCDSINFKFDSSDHIPIFT